MEKIDSDLYFYLKGRETPVGWNWVGCEKFYIEQISVEYRGRGTDDVRFSNRLSWKFSKFPGSLKFEFECFRTKIDFNFWQNVKTLKLKLIHHGYITLINERNRILFQSNGVSGVFDKKVRYWHVSIRRLENPPFNDLSSS